MILLILVKIWLYLKDNNYKKKVKKPIRMKEKHFPYVNKVFDISKKILTITRYSNRHFIIDEKNINNKNFEIS